MLFFWERNFTRKKQIPSVNCTKILLGIKKTPKLPYLEEKKSHVAVFRLGMSSYRCSQARSGQDIYFNIYFIERKLNKIKTKYFRAYPNIPKIFSFDFVEFSLIKSVSIFNNSNTLGLKSSHYLGAPLINGASLLVEGFPMV